MKSSILKFICEDDIKELNSSLYDLINSKYSNDSILIILPSASVLIFIPILII
jgi:hypothetical protein